jgi:hypothetical protein
MKERMSIVGVIVVMITLVSTTINLTPILLQQQSVYARLVHTGDVVNVPIATSGDNVYITWWTNKTGNDEVMFRASTDNGATFGDKINLSNSTKSDSQDAQIDSSGDRVFVTWWERNATSNQPVLKISNDNGKTFGSILKLATNGSINGRSGG